MHCLLCDEYMLETVSWYTFFVKSHKKYVCDRCERKLSYIIGEICMECGRPLELLSTVFKKDDICMDCIRWMKEEKYRPLKNRSLYVYDDEMKAVLAQFKFRGDAELVRIFYRSFRELFQKYFTNVSTVIPVPLSREREYERGFNQAELLAACLPVEISYLSLRRRKQKSKVRSHVKKDFREVILFIFKEKRCFMVNAFYLLTMYIRQELQ